MFEPRSRSYAMIAFVAIAVVIIYIMQGSLAAVVLEATYLPIALVFASILFLFPFTKYNTMTYEVFAKSYVADGQNAKIDALPLLGLLMLLTYHRAASSASCRRSRARGRRTRCEIRSPRRNESRSFVRFPTAVDSACGRFRR